jgi:hypothetical protein
MELADRVSTWQTRRCVVLDLLIDFEQVQDQRRSSPARLAAEIRGCPGHRPDRMRRHPSGRRRVTRTRFRAAERCVGRVWTLMVRNGPHAASATEVTASACRAAAACWAPSRRRRPKIGRASAPPDASDGASPQPSVHGRTERRRGRNPAPLVWVTRRMRSPLPHRQSGPRRRSVPRLRRSVPFRGQTSPSRRPLTIAESGMLACDGDFISRQIGGPVHVW